jgi:hypothetical protein
MESLLLSCKALSSSTTCRFIPAHGYPLVSSRRPTESRLRNMDDWDTSALFKLYFPETDSDWSIARF